MTISKTYLNFNKPLAMRLSKLLNVSKKYHRAEIHGAENIPNEGPALIVSNHGRIALDVFILSKLILDSTGRFPRGLMDHWILKVPVFANFAKFAGAVDGTIENGIELLKKDELAMCYPGGARDVFNNKFGSENIFWERSKGFVKLALKAQTPIIPIAGIGNNDGFIFLSEGDILGKIIYKKIFNFDMDLKKYKNPLTIGASLIPMPFYMAAFTPFPVKLDYYVGSPIYPNYPKEAANDETIVNLIHQRVVVAMREMFVKYSNKPLHIKALSKLF